MIWMWLKGVSIKIKIIEKKRGDSWNSKLISYRYDYSVKNKYCVNYHIKENIRKMHDNKV